MSNIFDKFDRYASDFLSPFKRLPEVYKEHVGQSLDLMGVGEGETGIGSKALGALGYALSPISATYQAFRDEPIRDVLIGQGVDPERAEKIAYMAGLGMDIATPLAATKLGATAQQAINRAYNPNVGNLALTQDITRRAKAHQTDRFLRDWYGGGKAGHLGQGILRGIGDYAKMFASPQKAYLFQKYGLSPSNVKDLERMFDMQETLMKGDKIRKVDKWGKPGFTKSGKKDYVRAVTLRNEVHANLSYIDSIFRKFMPNDKRRKAFEEELFEHIFPRQTFTSSDDLVKNAEPFRKILDIPAQISDDAIKTHLNPYVVGEWNLKGPIALNSRPLQSRPAQDLMREGKSHPLYHFKNIWIRMERPLTKDNMINFAEDANAKVLRGKGFKSKEEYKNSIIAKVKNSKWEKGPKEGRNKFTTKKAINKEVDKVLYGVNDKGSGLYNIDHLKNNIIDEGGYISIGGDILSEDRLWAHTYNRLIVKKQSQRKRGAGKPEGVWVVVDQMKQGSGVPGLEKAMDLGSKYNFLGADIFPMSRQFKDVGRSPNIRREIGIETGARTGRFGTQSVQTQTPFPRATTESDLAIMGATRRKMGERAPSEFVRQRLAQQGGRLGKGAIGAGILGGAFGEDVRRRRRIGAY